MLGPRTVIEITLVVQAFLIIAITLLWFTSLSEISFANENKS
jgi:hypothetical protein